VPSFDRAGCVADRLLTQIRVPEAASAVVKKLNDRFPAHNLVRAAWILYPRFYRNGSAGLNLESSLEMLIQTYGLVLAGAAGHVVGPLVDSDKRREQAKAFKSFAASSAKQIVDSGMSQGDTDVALDVCTATVSIALF
jgi:hypothetical protein